MEMVIKERASLGEAIFGFILMMKNYRDEGYVSFTLFGLCTFVGRLFGYIWKVHKLNHDPLKGQVVVATEKQKVVGAVCVECNPTSTPIDKMFPNEMKELYTGSESFAYLGSFAVAPKFRCTRLCIRILRNVWSMAEERGIDTLVCVVHPHHVSRYARLGCQFGPVAIATNMTGLKQAPAALLVIKVKESCPKA